MIRNSKKLRTATPNFARDTFCTVLRGTYALFVAANVTRAYRDTCWEWTLCDHRKNETMEPNICSYWILPGEITVSKREIWCNLSAYKCLMIELTYRYHLVAYYVCYMAAFSPGSFWGDPLFFSIRVRSITNVIVVIVQSLNCT